MALTDSIIGISDALTQNQLLIKLVTAIIILLLGLIIGIILGILISNIKRFKKRK